MTIPKASISALIHGEPGSGKSWLSATGPAPRLLLDAEGGSRFCKRNHPMVKWDPKVGPPPEWDGVWQSCFVNVYDWLTFDAAHKWLAQEPHPFKSVVIDSFTELQKRLVDSVSGIQQPTMQQWGEILRRMEDKARALRDLAVRDDNALEAVVVICLSHKKDDQLRPFVKGSLELSLPGFFDVVLYTYTAQEEATNTMLYQGLIAPVNNIIAKDRTNVLIEKYGPAVQDTKITDWLELINDAYS